MTRTTTGAEGFCFLFADERERRLQARDADREAGRGDLLARKARDEIVVTAATADGAEADGLAVVAFDLERQLGFEDGAGVIFEAADDGLIEPNAVLVVSCRNADFLKLQEVFDTRLERRAIGILRDGLFKEADDFHGLRRRKIGALCEIAALVLAALAEQLGNAFDSETVEFVDGAEHRQTAASILIAVEADCAQKTVQKLSAADFDPIIAALDAQRFEGVGGEHAHFGVGGDALGADGVSIELHELAEAAGTRLLVAIDVAEGIAAERLRQVLEILRDVAGERRRQIVAQAHPLLVLILEREDTRIGTILIGQKLAERVGVFDRRGLERFEAIALVDLADLRDHVVERLQLGRLDVAKAFGEARFRTRICVGFGHEDDRRTRA